MSVTTMSAGSKTGSKVGRPLAVQAYLSFEGRCQEALDFYRDALGAEITMVMHFKDVPPGNGCGEGPMPPPPGDKVMHSAFKIGTTDLFATDGMCQAGGASFNGISLSLPMPDEASADQAFAALADGGTIQMPLAATFFAKRFGMVADRFGVTWMVIVPIETC